MSRPKTIATDLRSHIGFWLRFVSNHVSHAFALKLAASGVTVAEWVVMREMFQRVDLSPWELAEISGLTRGAVSKLIDRLVAKGMVIREGREDDRRFQRIALSSTGNDMVPALAGIADANDAEFFGSLSAAERAALVATLRKLVAAHGLKKIPTE